MFRHKKKKFDINKTKRVEMLKKVLAIKWLFSCVKTDSNWSISAFDLLAIQVCSMPVARSLKLSVYICVVL